MLKTIPEIIFPLRTLSFCELTGLYWAWKMLTQTILVWHITERHFSLNKKSKDPFDNILTYDELAPLLSKYKVFVPKKRKYYIETLYSHYAHTHYAEHLDVTKEIIAEKYPDYTDSCNKVYKQTYGYMFNMMIMRKICSRTTANGSSIISFELEKRIGESSKELSFFKVAFTEELAR
mgnify:CR=1 FL=1